MLILYVMENSVRFIEDNAGTDRRLQAADKGCVQYVLKKMCAMTFSTSL